MAEVINKANMEKKDKKKKAGKRRYNKVMNTALISKLDDLIN